MTRREGSIDFLFGSFREAAASYLSSSGAQTALRHSQVEWQAWLSALKPRVAAGGLTYTDLAWLARKHDLDAFLAALYLEADRSEDEAIRQLKPAIVAAMKQP